MKNEYEQVFRILNKYTKGQPKLPVSEALEQYFQDYDLDHWKKTVSVLKDFLDEPFLLRDKESIIGQYIDINFNTKGHAPFLWLTTTLATIENRVTRVKNKEAAQKELEKNYFELFRCLEYFDCSWRHTPEEALNLFFNETHEEEWVIVARQIRGFLEEDLSKHKKIEIINQHVKIDWHYRNMPPLLWLKHLANSMDYRIDWNRI